MDVGQLRLAGRRRAEMPSCKRLHHLPTHFPIPAIVHAKQTDAHAKYASHSKINKTNEFAAAGGKFLSRPSLPPRRRSPCHAGSLRSSKSLSGEGGERLALPFVGKNQARGGWSWEVMSLDSAGAALHWAPALKLPRPEAPDPRTCSPSP